MGEVEFKEFRIGDLFEMVGKTAKGRVFEKSSSPTSRFMLPATSAKTSDNMWGYYVDPDEHNALKQCISVTANGMGYATYQPEDFAISQDSYALFLKDNSTGSAERVYKYLVVVLRKLLLNYDYNRKSGWARFSEDMISLPTTASGTPDFDYMENYIKEIEQKYIHNLKQKLETDKTNLLKVISKTEEDIEEVLKTGFNEEADFKEFKVGDLFNISRGDIKNRKGLGEIKEKEDDSVSFVAQNNNDNGFVSYVNKGDYTLFKGNSIVVGRQTGAVYYQKEDFVTTDGVLVLTPKFNMNSKIGLYITSVMGKLLNGYGYNNTVSVSKLKPMNMELPTNIDGEPDFQYMERYISYIELTHTYTILMSLKKKGYE